MGGKYHHINLGLAPAAMFACEDCGEVCHGYSKEQAQCTTGWGCTSEGGKVCYSCCAKQDKAHMRENGKIALYLTTNRGLVPEAGKWNNGMVTNWPGSLSFPCYVRKGRHNMARWRYDARFIFEGYWWHGVQYGDNTQIVHCRRTKEQAK